LHWAIAPLGLLSSAAPDPTTAEFALARVVARVDALGIGLVRVAAVEGAGIGAPVAFDVASAPRAPPCPEHVPRPVELDVVPSAQRVVTCAPAVLRATAVAAFVSLLTTFFSFLTAFLFTPPWPEHAPRPDDAEVVPSLQIAATACAFADNPGTAAIAAPVIERSNALLSANIRTPQRVCWRHAVQRLCPQ
jgi:hypothetical protein